MEKIEKETQTEVQNYTKYVDNIGYVGDLWIMNLKLPYIPLNLSI